MQDSPGCAFIPALDLFLFLEKNHLAGIKSNISRLSLLEPERGWRAAGRIYGCVESG
jgi:hypothetical protein